MITVILNSRQRGIRALHLNDEDQLAYFKRNYYNNEFGTKTLVTIVYPNGDYTEDYEYVFPGEMNGKKF